VRYRFYKPLRGIFITGFDFLHVQKLANIKTLQKFGQYTGFLHFPYFVKD